LTSDELVKAKEQLKGHIALSLDSNMELMFHLGKSIMIHNKIDSVQEIYHQIDEINLPEIQSSLEAFFNRDQMSELIYKF
jgi:predicted Zn-dependent peptidase